MDTAAVPGKPDSKAAVRPQANYESPRITYLGTLRELTLGGTPAHDGVGGAGDIGSVP